MTGSGESERLDRALLCTVSEAAVLLGIGRTVTYRLLNDGQLRSVKIGNRRLIPLSVLEEYVADLLEAS